MSSFKKNLFMSVSALFLASVPLAQSAVASHHVVEDVQEDQLYKTYSAHFSSRKTDQGKLGFSREGLTGLGVEEFFKALNKSGLITMRESASRVPDSISYSKEFEGGFKALTQCFARKIVTAVYDQYDEEAYGEKITTLKSVDFNRNTSEIESSLSKSTNPFYQFFFISVDDEQYSPFYKTMGDAIVKGIKSATNEEDVPGVVQSLLKKATKTFRTTVDAVEAEIRERKNLSERYDELRQKHQLTRLVIEGLDRSNQQSLKKIAELQRDLEDAELLISKLEREKTRALEEFVETKKVIPQTIRENLVSVQNILKLALKLKTAKEQSKNKIFNSLEDNLRQVTEELERDDSNAEESRLRMRSHFLGALDEVGEEAQRALSLLKEELAQEKRMNQKLQLDLEEKAEEQSRLISRLKVMEREREELEARLLAASETIDEKDEAIQKLTLKNSALTKAGERLAQERHDLEEHLSRSEQTVRALQDELRDLNEEKNRLTRSNKEAVERLEAEIARQEELVKVATSKASGVEEALRLKDEALSGVQETLRETEHLVEQLEEKHRRSTEEAEARVIELEEQKRRIEIDTLKATERLEAEIARQEELVKVATSKASGVEEALRLKDEALSGVQQTLRETKHLVEQLEEEKIQLERKTQEQLRLLGEEKRGVEERATFFEDLARKREQTNTAINEELQKKTEAHRKSKQKKKVLKEELAREKEARTATADDVVRLQEEIDEVKREAKQLVADQEHDFDEAIKELRERHVEKLDEARAEFEEEVRRREKAQVEHLEREHEGYVEEVRRREAVHADEMNAVQEEMISLQRQMEALHAQMLILQARNVELEMQIPPKPVFSTQEQKDVTSWEEACKRLANGAHVVMSDGSVLHRDLAGHFFRQLSVSLPIESFESSIIRQKKMKLSTKRF